MRDGEQKSRPVELRELLAKAGQDLLAVFGQLMETIQEFDHQKLDGERFRRFSPSVESIRSPA